ncbi:MAG: hypothetical protein M5U01_35825 [Ardenticatenaceae bacterium]|nr:hypothetical protein [Ardenticatenaceae bacterium]
MEPGDENLRRALLRFIGDFANWDLAANAQYLAVSRGLVRAAHPDETPLVIDPFAGGGSIPLEALRLGGEAFASDLNPVAVLIEKVMLEDIPRHGPELADELRRVGAEIKAAAERELAEFYPPGSNGARPIGYLWARTVRCESSNCGAEIPIFKTPWLSKRGAKRAKYFRETDNGTCVALIMESAPLGGPIKFRIARGEGSERLEPGFVALRATKASGNNSHVVCPCCNSVLKGDRVMAQLSAQRAGCEVEFDNSGNRVGGAYLLAVIEPHPQRGRAFRLPTRVDYEAVWKAGLKVRDIPESNPGARLNPVRPSPNARGLTAPTRYGAQTFGDLFTARQRLAITTLAAAIRDRIVAQGSLNDVSLAALLALGRCIDQTSAHVSWIPNIEAIGHSFPRQALQMVWDFVESVPIGDQSANYGAAVEWVRKVVAQQGHSGLRAGQTQQGDARELPLSDESVDIFFTDPPYYDAVPYADLSDFFLVWFNTILLASSTTYSRPLSDSAGLSPKAEEAVWNQAHCVNGKPKSREFFEVSVQAAFGEGRRALKDDGIACVVFAHKTTEGWEALLNGLLKSGWVIRASWPIVTERGVRTNAQNTASLASSIHLVCRPRPEDAPVGDWSVVLRELPRRVREWMERLQNEGVRGADLVFACIGPALEIYSRYLRVETAEGREVALPEYLEKVWEEIGRAALRQVLGTDAPSAVEEDARLTALFLWTMRSINVMPRVAKGAQVGDVEDLREDEQDSDDEDEVPAQRFRTGSNYSLPYDIVRRFCQPLGIHLERWEGLLIETRKGVVRLLSVRERARQILGDKTSRDLEYLQSTKSEPRPYQLELFELQSDETKRRQKDEQAVFVQKRVEGETWTHLHQDTITVLDHVHQAMLFQKQGMTTALRELLFYEQSYRPDFLRLANALSALYPRDSEEKRLLDAMLLAVPR